MTRYNQVQAKSTQLRMHYEDPLFHSSMCTQFNSYLPTHPREYIIVCIGTDRCTGDALGPLVGTYLRQLKPTRFTVYGTIHDPVHAKNIEETMAFIYATHEEPFIIAVDASLGKASSVGTIIAGIGSLQPGTALKKSLPKVGHVHIAGIVNVGGFMELTVLQNTRLSIVFDMAHAIARLLFAIDQKMDRVVAKRAFPM